MGSLLRWKTCNLRRELGEKLAAWKVERTTNHTFRALGVFGFVEDINKLKLRHPWMAAASLLALTRKQISHEPLDYVWGVPGLLPIPCLVRLIVDYSEASPKNHGRLFSQLFQGLTYVFGQHRDTPRRTVKVSRAEKYYAARV